MTGVDQNIVFLTANNANVTTTNGGGTAGTDMEILDLQVPHDHKFILKPENELSGRKGLRLRFDPDSSVPADLPDNASIILVGQNAAEEGYQQIGDRIYLRWFNSADQYNEDEVYRLDLSQRYTFTEDSHFKILLDSATAIDWSNSWIELEVERQTGPF